MPEAPKDAKRIFLAALDIQDAAERAAFVARSCENDEALRRRVEDLLHAFSESDGPLDRLPAAFAATGIHESLQEQVGSTIGPYKLMEQIGEGGFGLVFVAEQQQPIRRKVALKIIKPGMDTRDVIARFEAERQALALMDHPNIARVLDAGTTASGRPYFVMELVRGMPITDSCDQSQLTPRERLSLFVDVCNAVQHAHQKGIIHRDIKPSNVLVTLHDDRPVVKVIDFGVAKALHQRLTDKTIYTRLAQLVGTPLYMSPEQAQRSGLDIDTRSDIYSLGVLLYELLTGTTPFDKRRLAKVAYDELLKMIREEDPPKPSVRLSQSTETLPSIAAQRKTEPAKLSKMFHGDLDWIAMKSLEKDRARRYETANAFAADVLRYLNDEPVEASPPSTVYRLRKFARKHRRPVIALTAVAAVLLIGIAGTTWGLIRARVAEQAAVGSEQKTLDALGEVTRERDAKRAALNAEAAQRDRAERQFANGLLRPIGFSQTADAAELHSLVDWSGIEESSLKLRVLEIALENPETALRAAWRAEGVIQACVGLSPKRRAHARRLVAAKQRDLTADPEIRIAACWLAMELGLADLPAWAESCEWLGDPKNQSIDRFREFVNLAASRNDPRQIAKLDLDPLLAILETSTSNEVQQVLCDAVSRLAPRLESAQIKRAWDALAANRIEIDRSDDALARLAPLLTLAQVSRAGDRLVVMLENSTDEYATQQAILRLTALAPRLESAQVKRVGDALIGFLERSSDSAVVYAGSIGLQTFGPRLDSSQVKRAADLLIGILEKSTDEFVLCAACEGLATFVLRLEPVQVKRAADAWVAKLQRSTDEIVLEAAGAVLTAFSQRLEPAHVKRACDALIANPTKWRAGFYSTPHEVLKALAVRLEPAQAEGTWDALIAAPKKWSGLSYAAPHEVLKALAARLEPARVKHTGDALIAKLEEPADRDALALVTDGLTVLAPRLEPAQVKRAGDALVAMLGIPRDAGLLYAQCMELKALAPRLEPAQAQRAADTLIAMLEKPRDGFAVSSQTIGLTALAPRLDSAQVRRAGNSLIGMLEGSTDTLAFGPSSGLMALAECLEPAQAARVGDVLIMMLEKSTDNNVHAAASSGLQKLAPRLEPAQLTRAWHALLAVPMKLTSNKVHNDPAWAGLAALAPLLEPASRDNLSTTAAAALLDYFSSFEYVSSDRASDPMMLVCSISAPRSLATLLSHPACVAHQREVLLKRFEELVFHGGKPVFLKPNMADGKKFADDHLPPRRFHHLHDAADWIQKNWPDFDLETNCPVTWRGSR